MINAAEQWSGMHKPWYLQSLSSFVHTTEFSVETQNFPILMFKPKGKAKIWFYGARVEPPFHLKYILQARRFLSKGYLAEAK